MTLQDGLRSLNSRDGSMTEARAADRIDHLEWLAENKSAVAVAAMARVDILEVALRETTNALEAAAEVVGCTNLSAIKALLVANRATLAPPPALSEVEGTAKKGPKE